MKKKEGASCITTHLLISDPDVRPGTGIRPAIYLIRS